MSSHKIHRVPLIGRFRGRAGLVIVAATLAAIGCTEKATPTAPVTRPAQGPPSFTLNNGDAANSYYYASSEYSVQQQGEFETEIDNAPPGSRCPDEQIKGQVFVYLMGRVLDISEADHDDPFNRLIHFSIESKDLQFLHYTDRGFISHAEYRLKKDILSEDQRYQANVGAIAIMSCRAGSYSGRGKLRLYTGQVRLEGLSPIYKTRIGEDTECDDPMTEEVETTCAPQDPSNPTGSAEDYRVEFPSESGGGLVWACYYTDWKVSYDGGQTWQPDGTTSDGCYLEPAA